MNTIFKADEEYLANMQSYTIKHTCIALAFYVLDLLGLYAVGKIQSVSGKYYGDLRTVIFIAIVVLLVRFRLSKAGISWQNALPSIVTGLIMGIIFILCYTIIPGIIAGSTFLPAKKIADNVFYYFVIISFEEELVYRGFIQPRLYPLFKKEWVIWIVGGILFVGSHYPYHMAANEMSIIEYLPLFLAGAPIQFIWHIVFSWFYRRFGNIFGGTILHGFVDMSIGIFY